MGIKTFHETFNCVPGVLAALLLIGCGPSALNRSIINYDETMADLELKLLLVNIARRHHGQPVHFTATSTIAATFNWSQSASVFTEYFHITDEFNKSTGTLSASRSENPTFSIYPVTGEQFTKQILTPITEDAFNTVIFQGDLVEKTLRLMADGIEVQTETGKLIRYIANDPRRPEEYKEFRHIVSRLEGLSQRRKLFIRALAFDEILFKGHTYPPYGKDINNAVYSGLRWLPQPDGTYTLIKPSGGRVVVTTIDPQTLSNEERWRLNESIKTAPPSFVFLKINTQDLDGEFRIRGFVKLRSIGQILDFVASGIDKYPEFPVETGGSTGASPTRTLNIRVTDTHPPSGVTSIAYKHKHYAVAETDWDKTTFRILAWLFQSSVGEIKSPGLPITISK